MNLPSYPKIWNIGHPAVRDLFLDNVLVQEKVDGSQFSFCKLPSGEVAFRSKGAEVIPGAAGMFHAGVEAVLERASLLATGIIYRGEYLAKPKHNALKYDRVPKGHVILFDIHALAPGQLGETYLAKEADRIGFECVPDFFLGRIDSVERLLDLLKNESILGGAKIEGVVVKNYGRYVVQTGDPMFGKYVSEAFKEQHGASWKAANPQKADILAGIITALSTERRWEKAVERLRDCGVLQDAPQDIGKLMQAVMADVEEECRDEIIEALWSWAWPTIKRRCAAGLPEWYKQRLASLAFAAEVLPEAHHDLGGEA